MSSKYGYVLDASGNAIPIADPGAVQRGEVVALTEDSNKLGGKPASDYVQNSQVVNNFTTTEEGFVADARALKVLNDKIKNLTKITVTRTTNEYGQLYIGDYTNGRLVISILANSSITLLAPTSSEYIRVLNIGSVPITWRANEEVTAELWLIDN